MAENSDPNASLERALSEIHEEKTWFETDANGTKWLVQHTPSRPHLGTGRRFEEKTIRTEQPPEVESYQCGNCGHNQFQPLYKTIPPYRNTTTNEKIVGYECPSCSARFGDPRKFSKNRIDG